MMDNKISLRGQAVQQVALSTDVTNAGGITPGKLASTTTTSGLRRLWIHVQILALGLARIVITPFSHQAVVFLAARVENKKSELSLLSSQFGSNSSAGRVPHATGVPAGVAHPQGGGQGAEDVHVDGGILLESPEEWQKQAFYKLQDSVAYYFKMVSYKLRDAGLSAAICPPIITEASRWSTDSQYAERAAAEAGEYLSPKVEESRYPRTQEDAKTWEARAAEIDKLCEEMAVRAGIVASLESALSTYDFNKEKMEECAARLVKFGERCPDLIAYSNFDQAREALTRVQNSKDWFDNTKALGIGGMCEEVLRINNANVSIFKEFYTLDTNVRYLQDDFERMRSEYAMLRKAFNSLKLLQPHARTLPVDDFPVIDGLDDVRKTVPQLRDQVSKGKDLLRCAKQRIMPTVVQQVKWIVSHRTPEELLANLHKGENSGHEGSISALEGEINGLCAVFGYLPNYWSPYGKQYGREATSDQLQKGVGDWVESKNFAQQFVTFAAYIRNITDARVRVNACTGYTE
jgi:hypothetical protein